MTYRRVGSNIVLLLACFHWGHNCRNGELEFSFFRFLFFFLCGEATYASWRSATWIWPRFFVCALCMSSRRQLFFLESSRHGWQVWVDGKQSVSRLGCEVISSSCVYDLFVVVVLKEWLSFSLAFLHTSFHILLIYCMPSFFLLFISGKSFISND